MRHCCCRCCCYWCGTSLAVADVELLSYIFLGCLERKTKGKHSEVEEQNDVYACTAQHGEDHGRIRMCVQLRRVVLCAFHKGDLVNAV